MPWKSLEAKRAYNKIYRQTHKEEIKERDRQYRLKNKERLSLLHKKWVENNREYVRDKTKKRMRLWRMNNPERHKQTVHNRRLELRKKVLEYKNGKACVDCGESDPRCLDFHHREPKLKLFTISWALSNKLAWDTIFTEIQKCDLMCRNCHIKLTERMI